MNRHTLKVAKMAAIVGLAYVLKLPLLSIPNVEFITYLCFLSGYLFGIREGALVGAVAMTIYSLFNPYGPVGPVLLTTKVIATTIIGLTGGLVYRFGFIPGPKTHSLIMAGAFGLLLTLQFDFLTNLAIAIMTGQFWATMIAGVPFAAIHIGSNTGLFVIFNPLLFRLARLEHRL